MSIKLMTRVFDDENLNSVQKIVLLALADAANDDGICYPSYDTILLKAGLKSRSTLSDTLDYLEKNGYLTRASRGSIGTGKRTTQYRLFPISPPAGLIDDKSVTRTNRRKVRDADYDKSATRTETIRKNLRKNKSQNQTRACAREGVRADALPPGVERDAWNEWIAYRQNSGHFRKLKPASLTKQAQWLADFSVAEQQTIIGESIRNGWQGLFPPRLRPQKRSGIDEWLAEQASEEREVTGERIHEPE